MDPRVISQFALAARGLPQQARAQLARNAIIHVLAGQVSPFPYGEVSRDDPENEFAARYKLRGMNDGQEALAAPAQFAGGTGPDTVAGAHNPYPAFLENGAGAPPPSGVGAHFPGVAAEGAEALGSQYPLDSKWPANDSNRGLVSEGGVSRNSNDLGGGRRNVRSQRPGRDSLKPKRVDNARGTEAEAVGRKLAQRFNRSTPGKGHHEYTITTQICEAGRKCNRRNVFAFVAEITPPQGLCDRQYSDCKGSGRHRLATTYYPMCIGPGCKLQEYGQYIDTWVRPGQFASGNTTVKNKHVFDPGQVIHQVYEYDGFIYLHTLGAGNGPHKGFNEWAGPQIIGATHRAVLNRFR